MDIANEVLKGMLQHLCFITYEYDTKAVTAPSDDTMDATHSLVATLFGMKDLDLHHLVQFIIHHGQQLPGHPEVPDHEWGEKLFGAILKATKPHSVK